MAQPQLFLFADDGETPNNPVLPLVLYSGAVALAGAADPAAVFEEMFERNGWSEGWRNGIHGFLHFHTGTHEVLGIARGRARVQFGGAHGREVDLQAGDVAVLPAGMGHKRLSSSSDLLVVGAYPARSRVDQQRPGEGGHDAAVAAIARVALPAKDPVHGADGPLKRVWQAKPSSTQAKPSS